MKIKDIRIKLNKMREKVVVEKSICIPLLILFGLLLGYRCAPIPPILFLFMGTNNEYTYYSYVSKEPLLPYGEEWHGGFNPGYYTGIRPEYGDIRVYSWTLFCGGCTLEVWDPAVVEWVNVGLEPDRAAQIIRDRYLIYRPNVSTFQLHNVPVTFINGGSEGPTWVMQNYPRTFGAGTHHVIKIFGESGGHPTMRMVWPDGSEAGVIDSRGRVLVLREPDTADSFPPQIKDAPGMTPTYNPAQIPVVPKTFSPSIVVSEELGYLSAALIPSLPEDRGTKLYRGEMVALRLSQFNGITRNPDGTWTYTFQIADPHISLLPDTEYVFIVGKEQAEDASMPWKRYQKMSQDMSGLLIEESRPGVVPEDLGELTTTSRTDNYDIVYAYYFVTSSDPISSPPPLPPFAPSFYTCDVDVKPETLMCNHGTLTAFVQCFGNPPCNVCDTNYAEANGAVAWAIRCESNQEDENANVLILKFRRNEMTYPVENSSGLIGVWGRCSNTAVWGGSDIVDVIKPCP